MTCDLPVKVSSSIKFDFTCAPSFKLKSITNSLCSNENINLHQEKSQFWTAAKFNTLRTSRVWVINGERCRQMMKEAAERKGGGRVWVCLKTINSPWEAMFLSQTAADTASWSETVKKRKEKSSQSSCLSGISSSIIPTLHTASPSFLPVKHQPFYLTQNDRSRGKGRKTDC